MHIASFLNSQKNNVILPRNRKTFHSSLVHRYVSPTLLYIFFHPCVLWRSSSSIHNHHHFPYRTTFNPIFFLPHHTPCNIKNAGHNMPKQYTLATQFSSTLNTRRYMHQITYYHHLSFVKKIFFRHNFFSKLFFIVSTYSLSQFLALFKFFFRLYDHHDGDDCDMS